MNLRWMVLSFLSMVLFFIAAWELSAWNFLMASAAAGLYAYAIVKFNIEIFLREATRMMEKDREELRKFREKEKQCQTPIQNSNSPDPRF